MYVLLAFSFIVCAHLYISFSFENQYKSALFHLSGILFNCKISLNRPVKKTTAVILRHFHSSVGMLSGPILLSYFSPLVHLLPHPIQEISSTSLSLIYGCFSLISHYSFSLFSSFIKYSFHLSLTYF